MAHKFQDSLFLANLLPIYQSLLSPKQTEYLQLYLHEDYSLQEIADNFGVSKNAVHEAIRIATNNLRQWENEFHLFSIQQRDEKLIIEFDKSSNAETKAIVQVLKKPFK